MKHTPPISTRGLELWIYYWMYITGDMTENECV